MIKTGIDSQVDQVDNVAIFIDGAGTKRDSRNLIDGKKLYQAVVESQAHLVSVVELFLSDRHDGINQATVVDKTPCLLVTIMASTLHHSQISFFSQKD